MSKKIVLIAKGKANAQFLSNRLSAFLHKDVMCQGFDVEELPTALNSDLILLSSKSLLNHIGERLTPGIDILVIRRAIDPEQIYKLLSLDSHKRILVVNTTKETAEEVIELLYTMGFDYLWLIPYGPEMEIVPDADLVITPGEAHLVPSGFEIVDIGTRVIDLSTLMEILDFCGLMETSHVISAHYVRSFISLSKRIESTRRQVENSKFILTAVLNQISQASIVVDTAGNIVQTNKKARDLWGNHLNNISQLLDNKTYQSFKDDHIETQVIEINGQLFIVHRTSLDYDDKELLLFEPGDEVNKRGQYLRRNIRARGFVAKYTFKDIVGSSTPLCRTIELAKIYSQSNSPVLIEGPTGCGKELFAHAIHEHSDRTTGPFVAINCGALPDTLLESELFGYEEGAFTGAKKGGKPGMFELATGGTIFIDEIEDLPLPVQVKLLRVFSEHEIIRVGGQTLIPIDARIIAATNRNVNDLVTQGRIREDLLYRLNVLPLSVPTLKERKMDIPALVAYFEHQIGKQNLITSKEMDQLQEYDWPGNIRELRNRIELLYTIKSTKNQISNTHFFSSRIGGNSASTAADSQANNPKPLDDSADPVINSNNSKFDQIEAEILHSIADSNLRGIGIGRKQLSLVLASKLLIVTEASVRGILHDLEHRGLVQSFPGRRGTWLTSNGELWIKSNV